MRYREDFRAMGTPALLAIHAELSKESASLDDLFEEYGAEWGDRASQAGDELAFLEAELRDRNVKPWVQ